MANRNRGGGEIKFEMDAVNAAVPSTTTPGTYGFKVIGRAFRGLSALVGSVVVSVNGTEARTPVIRPNGDFEAMFLNVAPRPDGKIAVGAYLKDMPAIRAQDEFFVGPAGMLPTAPVFQEKKDPPTPDHVEVSTLDYPRCAGSVDLPDFANDFTAGAQVTASGKGVKAKIAWGGKTPGEVETDEAGYAKIAIGFRHMDDSAVVRVVGTKLDKAITPRLWVR